MKIKVNGYTINIQEGDEVAVSQYECEDCGSHMELEVYRGGKVVAHVGDEVRLNGVENFGDGIVVP